MKLSSSQKRKSAASQILYSICKNNKVISDLVKECEMFINEVNKCAMLLHEEWFESLENSSKMYYTKDYQGMVKYLQKLHEKAKMKPETMYELHFYQKFSKFDLKKYKHFITELKHEEKKEEEKRKNFRNQFKFNKREIKDYSVKSYDSDKKSNSKEKKFSPIADIGRYNPNYNSIRKNEPKIFISKNGFIPNIKLK